MFKNLEPKTRGILTIIIVIVIIIVLWIIYRQIVKYTKNLKESKDLKETVDDADNEYNSFIKKGDKLSNPQSAYDGVANVIEKLLSGCETFSSEMDSIKEVIKVVNKPIDWVFLVKTFGVRDIADCGSFGLSTSKYDLSALLKDQLDSSGAYSINNINKYSDSSVFTQNSVTVLEKFLKSRGVTF